MRLACVKADRARALGQVSGRGNSFSNFAAVAVAPPKLQNVLVSNHAGEFGGGADEPASFPSVERPSSLATWDLDVQLWVTLYGSPGERLGLAVLAQEGVESRRGRPRLGAGRPLSLVGNAGLAISCGAWQAAALGVVPSQVSGGAWSPP